MHAQQIKSEQVLQTVDFIKTRAGYMCWRCPGNQALIVRVYFLPDRTQVESYGERDPAQNWSAEFQPNTPSRAIVATAVTGQHQHNDSAAQALIGAFNARHRIISYSGL